MNTERQAAIFGIILQHEPIAISGIFEQMPDSVSMPTLNRELVKLKAGQFILAEGNGPGTKYRININGLVKADIDPDLFFKTDVDNRKIIERYNPFIIERLVHEPLFSNNETALLENATGLYHIKLKNTSTFSYKKEFERLMIELSWKSSQIEGNTYDLLDTEQLLKYNIEAPYHSKEEAQMLLNHKAAIEYTATHAAFFQELSVGNIIDIHTLLTRNMGISKSIRQRIVRITGTRYTPPDNQFLIEEGLENLCTIVNANTNPYEKALLTVLLISYLQPFEDGNKRTARLTANALLMSADLCPLSYRSIRAADYKKAILLFYELNNISAFKKIFVAQYQFAVENYF